jgi:hypothetical protein
VEIKKHHLLLIGIFLFSIAFRLIFAFQTPYFSDDNSYFVLRQVEHITEHGIPLYDDSLSYSGRTLPYTPFFYYVLALFNLFMPLSLVAKIIPNILASTMVFAAYLLTYEITKNKKAALTIAFTSAIVPIFIKETINSVSDISIILPILFFIIYCLLKLDEGTPYVVSLSILITLFILTSPISFILLLGLFIYFVLLKTEKIEHEHSELEIILFTGFLYFWFNFLIFKKALLLYGPSILRQNIPQILIPSYFSDINILESVYAVGIIPFIFGIFIIYTYVFKQKNKAIYLLTGMSLSVFILLTLKLIPFISGLLFLASFLVLLLGQYIKNLLVYLEKSKLEKRVNFFLALIVFLIFVSSIIPCIFYSIGQIKNVPSKENIRALLWLKENTPKNSAVLAPIEEGHLITYFSQRKDIIDSNFLLINDIDQRIQDIDNIYTTIYTTDAVKLLNKYQVNYIMLSAETQKKYALADLKYYEPDCFELVYNDSMKIYRSFCRVDID